MTFLLNIIPIIITMIGIGCIWYFQFKKKSIKGVIWSIVITVSVLYFYQAVQPSYIPKTGVEAMKRLELVEEVEEVSDRTKKKQMTTEERNEHFETNVLTYDDKIKVILEE